MTKRPLLNDLNIKDENRNVNASYKLALDIPGSPFTYDDNVIPAMICGIEENQTNSSVDLISCVRDLNGFNRLCVDVSGLKYENNEQTLFSNDQGLPLATNYFMPTIPQNKVLYLKGFVFSNNNDTTNVIDLVLSSPSRGVGITTKYGHYVVPINSSFAVYDQCLKMVTGDTLIIYSDVKANIGHAYYWGFYQ